MIRRLLLSLCLLACAAPAHGAVAYVQGDWDANAAESTSISYNSGLTVTSGNAMVVAVRWTNEVSVSSVTDNLGNTYTPVDSTIAATSFGLATFVASNITGGANYTVTANFSGNATHRAVAFHEVSGVATSSPVDANAIQSQAAPGTGSNALTSGTDTTTVDGCYIFGALAETGPAIDDADATAGTSFTARLPAEGTGGFGVVIGTEDRILASAGSVAATWTHSSGGGGTWITAMVALKPAGAAPACTPRLMLLGVGC